MDNEEEEEEESDDIEVDSPLVVSLKDVAFVRFVVKVVVVLGDAS